MLLVRSQAGFMFDVGEARSLANVEQQLNQALEGIHSSLEVTKSR